MYSYTSLEYGSLPSAPATSPSTALGVGTFFDAGMESVSGELKKVSVVYFLMPFVYSSSRGWFGSRAGFALARSASVAFPDFCGLAGWAATGTTRAAITSSGRSLLHRADLFMKKTSYRHRFQRGDAGFRELHVLFDEVIFHAADLRGLERLDPVDAPLSNRRLRAPPPALDDARSAQIDVLHVHGDEAALVFREVLVSGEAIADRGHLELELDQFGIEQLHQDVVGTPAVDARQLEALVVQPLLDARPRRHRGDRVVFVGSPFHIVHRRIAACAKRRDEHLGHPDLPGPVDAFLLVVAQLAQVEVRALARQPVVGQGLHDLPGVGQARKVRVPERRAQLDPFDPDVFQGLQEAGEVSVLDQLPVRIRLAADRQSEGIRLEDRSGGGRQQSGRRRIGRGLPVDLSP